MKKLYYYKNDKIGCVIPKAAGRMHPLHGFYDKSVIKILEFMLTNKIKRIRYLFDSVETRFVDKFGCYMELSTVNIDSPEMLDKLKGRGCCV